MWWYMDTRIYPTVSKLLTDREDEKFDWKLRGILSDILTVEVVKGLAEERYAVLTESVPIGSSRLTYNEAIERFRTNEAAQIKPTFERLVLCYAAAGVIPVTQARLGDVVIRFLEASGAWTEVYREHVDAMFFRASGSYGHGKRR